MFSTNTLSNIIAHNFIFTSYWQFYLQIMLLINQHCVFKDAKNSEHKIKLVDFPYETLRCSPTTDTTVNRSSIINAFWTLFSKLVYVFREYELVATWTWREHSYCTTLPIVTSTSSSVFLVEISPRVQQTSSHPVLRACQDTKKTN